MGKNFPLEVITLDFGTSSFQNLRRSRDGGPRIPRRIRRRFPGGTKRIFNVQTVQCFFYLVRGIVRFRQREAEVGRMRSVLAAAFSLFVAITLPSTVWAQGEQTPVNFKVAFIGDQGLNSNSKAVLNLIKNEGADAVVHAGDFDYVDNPAGWDGQINGILGPDFPYFSSPGNHDTGRFYGSGGYQEFIVARMNRLGITWDGDLGVKSSFYYKRIFIVRTAPGVFSTNHSAYIRRISSWHKNQKLMQVGGKTEVAPFSHGHLGC